MERRAGAVRRRPPGATLEVDTWRLGLGVCYDGCFPEHARAAARDGAHGYLCPSGYLAGSAHRRDLYYAARALDNTMYVVFANAVGGADPWRFNGGGGVRPGGPAAGPGRRHRRGRAGGHAGSGRAGRHPRRTPCCGTARSTPGGSRRPRGLIAVAGPSAPSVLRPVP
ncbi:carbon-nitrogen hydrolase family protein [Micromonospora sp. BRA006-A]|nr:carbon-nitrogen hydrolase family protein [Micromonospora sp. BRA006-A]